MYSTKTHLASFWSAYGVMLNPLTFCTFGLDKSIATYLLFNCSSTNDQDPFHMDQLDITVKNQAVRKVILEWGFYSRNPPPNL